MIYLIIILSFIILSYVYDYRGVTRFRLIWWLSMMVVLICVAGFRYQMGTDSIKYENEFKWLQPTLQDLRAEDFKNTRFAPLYIILSAACKSLTPEFMLVQFVVATIVNCTIFRFIWKNTPHTFLAGLLYCFFLYFMLNMEVLREAIASCVFLWSWPFFKKGKWIPYYLLSCVAFFFHVSAVVLFLLPVLWLPGVRSLFTFGKRTLLIVLFVIAMSFSIRYFLFDFVKLIALTDSMAERAEVYSKSEFGTNILNVKGAAVTLLRLIVYPLAAIYLLHKNGKITAAYDGERKMEMLSLLQVYAVCMSIGISIFLRYNHYFMIFSIILISRVAYTVVHSGKRRFHLNYVYWCMILTPLFSLQVYDLYLAPFNKSGSLKCYQMYYPYSNQFDKEISPDRKKIIQYSRRL